MSFALVGCGAGGRTDDPPSPDAGTAGAAAHGGHSGQGGHGGAGGRVAAVGGRTSTAGTGGSGARGGTGAAGMEAVDAGTARPDASVAEPGPQSGDPGTKPWVIVPTEDVREVCKLDPDLLAEIQLDVPWLVVRYGRACWAAGGALSDSAAQNFSTTKTLGATVLGMVAYDTRNIPRTGRKTGPLQDTDRVDFWLDAFSYNQDALIAHVLGMEAQNADLSYGRKKQSYDTDGDVQINTLATVMNAALAQDTARLGANLDAYAKKRVFARLGMEDSTWDADDLSGSTGWHSGVGDMARLGLLLLHGGMWDGERLLDARWVYKMTHPSFEDGNTAYGYLTWVNARNNWHLAGLEEFTSETIDPTKPLLACAPAAIHARYPHAPSDAPDCDYLPPATCAQEHDVGVWEANGFGGQLIIGHPGLDLVVVARNFSDAAGTGSFTLGNALWDSLLPAIVAEDPRFQGDRTAFCAAYQSGSYAPDVP